MSRRKGVKKGEAKDTYIELTFPEFFMRQIKAKEIKVLHPDFLKLRSNIDKAIYCTSIKMLGKKPTHSIGLAKLSKHIGTKSALKEFRSFIRQLVKEQRLPGLYVAFDAHKDLVTFIKSETQEPKNTSQSTEKSKDRRSWQRKNAQNINERILNLRVWAEHLFGHGNYDIFKTSILSFEALHTYLLHFPDDYVKDKIRQFITVRFTDKRNPRGYFYSLLEKDYK